MTFSATTCSLSCKILAKTFPFTSSRLIPLQLLHFIRSHFLGMGMISASCQSLTTFPLPQMSCIDNRSRSCSSAHHGAAGLARFLFFLLPSLSSTWLGLPTAPLMWGDDLTLWVGVVSSFHPRPPGSTGWGCSGEVLMPGSFHFFRPACYIYVHPS